MSFNLNFHIDSLNMQINISKYKKTAFNHPPFPLVSQKCSSWAPKVKKLNNHTRKPDKYLSISVLYKNYSFFLVCTCNIRSFPYSKSRRNFWTGPVCSSFSCIQEGVCVSHTVNYLQYLSPDDQKFQLTRLSRYFIPQ